jgi:hypothetical protein
MRVPRASVFLSLSLARKPRFDAIRAVSDSASMSKST